MEDVERSASSGGIRRLEVPLLNEANASRCERRPRPRHVAVRPSTIPAVRQNRPRPRPARHPVDSCDHAAPMIAFPTMDIPKRPGTRVALRDRAGEVGQLHGGILPPDAARAPDEVRVDRILMGQNLVACSCRTATRSSSVAGAGSGFADALFPRALGAVVSISVSGGSSKSAPTTSSTTARENPMNLSGRPCSSSKCSTESGCSQTGFAQSHFGYHAFNRARHAEVDR